jgi:CBS domain-containing protein
MKELHVTTEKIMTRPAIAAGKHTPAKDIAFEIFYGFFSGVPVTDENGIVIGIVTELDLLKQVRAGKDFEKLTADDIMTKDPITIDVTTPLKDVLHIMIEKNIIRIPVTKEGRLAGVIARRDILRYYLQPENFRQL